MDPDTALLRRYAEDRSEEAFAELVGRHLNLVFSAALRRTGGNRAQAEEISQQVFIAAARSAASLARHPLFSAWLYAATRNAAFNLLRSERRRRAREEKAQLMQTPRSVIEEVADWHRIRPLLDDLMDRLNEKERTALILRFFDGLAFGEIGARLEISEDAARMRVDRALDKLRVALRRAGVGSTTAALSALLAEEVATAAPAHLAAAVAGAVSALPAGSAAASGLVSFMSTTKISLGLAGLLCLAAILSVSSVGLAVREFASARAADAARVELEKSNRAARARVAALQRGLASAEAARMALAAGGRRPNAASVSPAVRGAAHGPGTLADRRADGQRFLTAFPQVRDMLVDALRTQLTAVYEGFYRSAGLTPAQIAQFEQQWTEKSLQNLEIASQEGPGFDPAVTQLSDDELRQILGDAGLQQFQAYDRTAVGYLFAGQVAAAVGYTETPLTPDQIDALVAAIGANSPDVQAGNKLQLAGVNWDGVGQAAQGILTPSQWQTAQSLFLGNQYRQSLTQAEETKP